MTGKKYKTIVIDPPWKVSVPASFGRRGPYKDMPYDMMTDKQIAQFPIDDFADSNCDLFMWTTQGKLPTAFDIIHQWGFKYSRLITWNKGIGPNVNGFTHHTELLVYAYRGKTQRNYKAQFIPTIFNAKRKKHSEKPSSVYESLRASTAEPRIDIFARRRHAGFDAWGDQVEAELQTVLEVKK